jgi:hypothetical protein
VRISDFGRNALSICAAVAFLAGCGGSQPPIGAPGAIPQGSAIATHAGHDTSWMLPEAKGEDLLYTSNSWTVTVYSYPKGRHVGTLRHFYRPLGECVDTAGDVFIANGTAQVFEYAHGGTKKIGTLSMTGYQPQSCGVDPTTENLAVTWDKGLSQGYIAVYQGAKGTPTLYSNGNMLTVFCGYDNQGNLFVDGFAEGSGFRFAELPKGGSALENIALNQSFGNPGAVQWDGKYVAVGDDEYNNIYRFSISGSSGTLESTTSLGGAQSVLQWWIDGGKVIGSDELEPDTTFYWSYPTGGEPVKSFQLKDIGAPAGATISKARK